MSENNKKQKSVAEKEQEVLKFWKEKEIFKKSVEQDAPQGEFVFYDGPPFATGLPHHGSLLSSVIKDVVPRYKTMRGFRVARRWGWDCHGLPIESLIEKRLMLKTKKDIEKIGVATFNNATRASVLEYEREWEKYVERVGRFVDFKHSYKTMDNSYMERVWWGLKELHQKGLLYEGKKVLMYCPHCETPLAKAEIAMDHTYKEITEEAVTVEFKVHGESSTYLLAWTTTPWTLLGNVALAVNPEIDYVMIEKKDMGVGKLVRFVLAKERLQAVFGKDEYKIIEEKKGKKLVGLKYEPLFDISALQSEKSYKVYAADFVNTEEGTGIVHTAVMYGEDDFALGVKEELPQVQLLDAGAKYNENAPEFFRGKYVKDAEKEIKADLEKRGLLFARANNTHEYPHCYRCGTPLIYNAVPSWFIAIQQAKKKMLAENEKIHWVPPHLKHGRFQNTIEGAPDWNISRNRFWATPLPIWKCENCRAVRIIGSLNELQKESDGALTKIILVRHGESEKNTRNVFDSSRDTFPLTEAGRIAARNAAQQLHHEPISALYASPVRRAAETASIIAQAVNIPVLFNDALWEVRSGAWEGTVDIDSADVPDRIVYLNLSAADYYSAHRGKTGESWEEVEKRIATFFLDVLAKHRGKTIVLVSHEGPLLFLFKYIKQLTLSDVIILRESGRVSHRNLGAYAEPITIYVNSQTGTEFDMHRPYIDALSLKCPHCSSIDSKRITMRRIPEVVDCWVESAAMPFATESRMPADFIAEYIAQTRTWFYYLHALGVLLFGGRTFNAVVSTGTILAHDGEKISKSKGNYTDPLLLMDKYGADAFRFYLMGSVVMQGEDLRFSDEGVREAHNRVVGILRNCLAFFGLYKNNLNGETRADKSAHILDKWILARLRRAVSEITEAMEAYDTPRACREIRAFTEDYSTWYIRRSRERVKPASSAGRGGDESDKQYCLAVQREVLRSFSKIIAPVLPFLAEEIYRAVGGEQESVHLEQWPEAGEQKSDARLLEEMQEVRNVVSRALLARAQANIKVRQPLLQLKVKSEKLKGKKELLGLVQDEVNVKEVLCDKSIAGEVELDTTLTPALREEGDYRELLRAVQDLRKKHGLTISDRATLMVATDDTGKAFVEKFSGLLKKSALLKDIAFGAVADGEKMALHERVYVLALK